MFNVISFLNLIITKRWGRRNMLYSCICVFVIFFYKQGYLISNVITIDHFVILDMQNLKDQIIMNKL